jgi:hypothetical protein
LDLSNKALRVDAVAKHVHKPGYKFPVEKRIEVVTKWLAIGNMRKVADLTGVSYQLCRMWKQEKWWQEIVDEVQASRHNQVNTKLSKIVDKSLAMIQDRLTNGDFIFNNKTGTVERKEVSLKDATKVATDLLTRQAVLQKQEQDQTVQQTAGTIKDQLAMLALEFAKFNKRDNSKAETIAFVESTDDAEFEGVALEARESREDEAFSFEMEDEQSGQGEGSGCGEEQEI